MPAVIDVQNLHKTYGDTVAVDDVSLPWLAIRSATRVAFSVCRVTRNSSVSRPFRSTQELNGDSAGPVWRRMSL